MLCGLRVRVCCMFVVCCVIVWSKGLCMFVPVCVLRCNSLLAELFIISLILWKSNGAHCHCVLFKFGVVTLFGLASDDETTVLNLIVSMCLQTGGETES